MDIIAISGISNTGKTHCLQKLIYEMSKDSKNKISCINHAKAYQQLITNGAPVINRNMNKIDFSVVVERNGKRAGITTYGDNKYVLLNVFEKMNIYNCDLIVCACHTKGETIDFLKNLPDKSSIVIHNRWAVSDSRYWEKTMQYQVNEIKNEIEKLLE